MTRASRPSRTTMAGMIYDANEALKWVMDDPEIKEAFCNSSGGGGGGTSITSSRSYKNLFAEGERDLLGIGFFTIWEAGLVVSGNIGTGIVLSRNAVTGAWSGPAAVGVSSVGIGLLVGASVKTIVYLIYDYFTLESIVGGAMEYGGIIFGVSAGATIGSWWSKQTGEGSTVITSPKTLRSAGLGSNIALSKGLAGLFCSVSIEGGICKSRDKVNAQFYGRDNLTGSDILLSGEHIEIPDNNDSNSNSNSSSSSNSSSNSVGDKNQNNNNTSNSNSNSNVEAKQMMEKVYAKLRKLCSGDNNNDDADDDDDGDGDGDDDGDAKAKTTVEMNHKTPLSSLTEKATIPKVIVETGNNET